jgi:hypothetical protein
MHDAHIAHIFVRGGEFLHHVRHHASQVADRGLEISFGRRLA